MRAFAATLVLAWNVRAEQALEVIIVIMRIHSQLSRFAGRGCEYKVDACAAGVCKNGGTCVSSESGGIGGGGSSRYRCMCPPNWSGEHCEMGVDACATLPCPLAATCLDQPDGGHYCRCAFNMTGIGCDKLIDADYELRMHDGEHGARAALAVPFHFASGALTIAMWIRFDAAHERGDVVTLYDSGYVTYRIDQLSHFCF